MLNRLGLEECFEGVVCFETLNPVCELEGSSTSSAQICDINYLLSVGSVLPRTPIVCKPFTDAFEEAFKIAKINPQKAVS